MKIMCIGDVVSAEGRETLLKKLPLLKRQYRPDYVIVNGENAALGNGIDTASMREILSAGADVITGGNHSLHKAAAEQALEEIPCLLRPENLGNTFGRGWYRAEGRKRDLLVINLQGLLFLPENQNPFTCVEVLLERVATPRDIIVVDFHAEASSEKKALGYFLDGKAALVFGTHTHVPTADETILPGGTGYVTDIGMTGVAQSILGKDIETAIHNFKCWGQPQLRKKTKDAKGEGVLNGIVVEIDEEGGKCLHIERIYNEGE